MTNSFSTATMASLSQAGEKPTRMCVICRCRQGKNVMSRYTLSASGDLEIDYRQTRPGRGWYCCKKEECRLKFSKYRPKTRTRGIR